MPTDTVLEAPSRDNIGGVSTAERYAELNSDLPLDIYRYDFKWA